MSTVEISEGFPEDQRARVVELMREYEVSLPGALSFPEELESLPGEYRPPGGGFAVVRTNGKIVGFVGLRTFDADRRIGEMKRLYLTPPARSGGLGRKLALYCLDMARRRGFRAIRLDTLPFMVGAQSLYRSMGFREIGNYNGNPVDGVIFMEIELSGEGPVA